MGDDNIKKRAAWLRGKAQLGVRAGLRPDADPDALRAAAEARVSIEQMREEAK